MSDPMFAWIVIALWTLAISTTAIIMVRIRERRSSVFGEPRVELVFRAYIDERRGGEKKN